MANVIRLRKGLDINLVGAAQGEKSILPLSTEYALVPDAFVGVTPKIAVKEGDIVKAGDALFVNKQQPDVKFASPVSGVVTAVERGERRKVLCVKVKADAEQQYADFGKKGRGGKGFFAGVPGALSDFLHRHGYDLSAQSFGGRRKGVNFLLQTNEGHGRPFCDWLLLVAGRKII